MWGGSDGQQGSASRGRGGLCCTTPNLPVARPQAPVMFFPRLQLSAATICCCGISDCFHTYFLKPPAHGGKDTQWKMNSFGPGPHWGIFLVHPSPGIVPSQGSRDWCGHATALARPHFLSPWRESLWEISLKCFCRYFPGRPWERPSADFAAGKMKSEKHWMWHRRWG